MSLLASILTTDIEARFLPVMVRRDFDPSCSMLTRQFGGIGKAASGSDAPDIQEVTSNDLDGVRIRWILELKEPRTRGLIYIAPQLDQIAKAS